MKGVEMDSQTVSVNWWALTLRGIVAILFGVAAVFWPGLTLLTLLYLFSAYVLVSGIVDIIHGIDSVNRRGTWFLTLILGFVQLGVGVYLLRHPSVSFATLILLIGFTLIIRGVFEGVAAFSEVTTPGHRLLAMIGAAVAIVAGILVLFQPEKGGVAFVWLLGLYALIVGPIMIAMSLDVRQLEVAANGSPRRRNA